MRPILSGKHNTSWMTRELSDGAGRSTIFWVLAAVCLSCQASPQEIPIVMHAGKTADGNKIAEYPSALDAILRVLVEKFGLPIPRYALVIYPRREEFEAALVSELKF